MAEQFVFTRTALPRAEPSGFYENLVAAYNARVVSGRNRVTPFSDRFRAALESAKSPDIYIRKYANTASLREEIRTIAAEFSGVHVVHLAIETPWNDIVNRTHAKHNLVTGQALTPGAKGDLLLAIDMNKTIEPLRADEPHIMLNGTVSATQLLQRVQGVLGR